MYAYKDYVYLVGILIFSGFLLYEISLSFADKIGLAKDKSKKIAYMTKKKLYSKLSRRAGIIRRRLMTMNMADRKKSKLYWYYSKISVTLTSLNLTSVTNPETVFLLITITSVLLTGILTIGMPLFVKVLTLITSFTVMHALLTFFAHTETVNRIYAIIDAEDRLSSNMEDGILESVHNNLHLLDKRVKPAFNDFYQSVQSFNEDIETAMLRLNMVLGKSMDNFCENSLIYYMHNDPVILGSFKAKIEKNSKRRIVMARQQAMYKTNMFLYVFCTLLSFGFGYVGSAMMGVQSYFYSDSIGRTIQILSICFSLVGFVASQIIYSSEVE